MTEDSMARDIGFVAALAAYEDAGRPPACPRCGDWNGIRLPMCTDAGWAHHESCTRMRYGTELCAACTADLACCEPGCVGGE